MRTDDPSDVLGDRLSVKLQQSLQTRLLAWAVRWTISFALIALAVWYWPQASWLWWAGAIVAALSLAALLTINFVMGPKLTRKLEDLQARAQELDALDQSLGDEDRPGTTKH